MQHSEHWSASPGRRRPWRQAPRRGQLAAGSRVTRRARSARARSPTCSDARYTGRRRICRPPKQALGPVRRTLGTYRAAVFDAGRVVDTDGTGWDRQGATGARRVQRAHRRPRRHYDDALRAQALRLATELGSDRAAEQELGLSNGLIRYWRRTLNRPVTSWRLRLVMPSARPTSPPAEPRPAPIPRPWISVPIAQRPFDPEATRARAIEAIFETERS